MIFNGSNWYVGIGLRSLRAIRTGRHLRFVLRTRLRSLRQRYDCVTGAVTDRFARRRGLSSGGSGGSRRGQFHRLHGKFPTERTLPATTHADIHLIFPIR